MHRSARVVIRPRRQVAERCYGILRSAGDIRAALIEMNRYRRRRGDRAVFGFPELCRELTGVDVGELARHPAEDVLHRYSTECFEVARRKKAGHDARFPRRKRALYPVRFRHGSFTIAGRRVRLATARGAPALWVKLSRPLPYPPEAVRSLTLLAEGGRLALDITAELPVADAGTDPARIAGVDPGQIHPFAAVGPSGEALLVSGRAIRAEDRVHLADTKARQKKMSRIAPKRGQRGSRRWRKLRAAQRRAEARHARRVRQASYSAARVVVAWGVANRIGTLVVGDPRGINAVAAGARQNLRNANWRRLQARRALHNAAEVLGIEVRPVDERGTSSTCPSCARKVPKPKGRVFVCNACGYRGHRDLVGARNIAAIGGGMTTEPSVVTHRRVGTVPARRDRRRHLMDLHRSGPARHRAARRSSTDPPGVALVGPDQELVRRLRGRVGRHDRHQRGRASFTNELAARCT